MEPDWYPALEKRGSGQKGAELNQKLLFGACKTLVGSAVVSANAGARNQSGRDETK